MPRGQNRSGRGRGMGHGSGWRSGQFGQRFSNFNENMGQRLAGKGIYRSRNGRLFGVCRGIADYLDVRVSTVRIITFVAFLFTGIWPVGILYLVAAALMKQEPVVPFESADDREFYDSYAGSRAGALTRLKRRFDGLDRRIQRMEDVVTSRDFQWEQKMGSPTGR